MGQLRLVAIQVEAFNFNLCVYMAKYSKELLEKTIQVWQAHSPEPLSLDDAQKILDNAISLYSYLFELKQKYDQEETNL